MAQSYLVFDFGANEEAAQQARHRIEGWKQAFRLGSKLLLRFERQDSQKEQEKEEKPQSGKTKSQKDEKKADPDSDQTSHIRLFLRLDFSDHEKLSHQRWLQRIPGEEPFKSAQSQAVHRGDIGFEKTAELFDSLT